MTMGVPFCIVNVVMALQRKEYAMSAPTFNSSKHIQISRILVIGLITLLGIAVITVLVWIQTDQVIAPPSLRIKEWLWTWIVFLFPFPV